MNMIYNKRVKSKVLSQIMSSITEEDKCYFRNRMSIAVKIADALKAKDLCPKDFAKLIGKSEGEMCEWLSGNKDIPLDILYIINEYLNLGLDI